WASRPELRARLHTVVPSVPSPESRPMTRPPAFRALLCASLFLALAACASHSGVRDDAPPPPVGAMPAQSAPDVAADPTAPAQLSADDTVAATAMPADEAMPVASPQA